MSLKITRGFSPIERAQVASMYWHAFGRKLGRIMGPDARAIAFIYDVLDPTHAICAHSDSGKLLGVVGFKTYQSALVGGTWPDMRKHYGTWGAIWRTALVSLLERDTENERFLMDGIFVNADAQGLGVGTALLDAICTEAQNRGYREIRLDVIDTNPRARALYERQGFVPAGMQSLGLLRYVFGFQAATTMIRRL